jgi:thiol-disulfide isomerase/thioredoxin
MRRMSWLAMAVIAWPLAVAAAEVQVGAPKPMPALSFETMDGEPASLEQFRGKVVVLNMWATWCVPCRKEMPSLDRLQTEVDPTKIVVVALSVDHAGPERVLDFLKDIGVSHLRVYRDPEMAAIRAVRSPGLPTTIVVDPQGQEVGRVLGEADWSDPKVVAALESLVPGPASERAAVPGETGRSGS